MRKTDPETGEITEEPDEVRPFAEWLEDQRNGLTHAELTNSLKELVEAVNAYGKGGSLTLTIKLEPAGDGMVAVKDDIKLKAPLPDRSINIFYVDDGMNLRRDNPRQQQLDLREVPAPRADIREIR
jgi:hypothetical protein